MFRLARGAGVLDQSVRMAGTLTRIVPRVVRPLAELQVTAAANKQAALRMFTTAARGSRAVSVAIQRHRGPVCVNSRACSSPSDNSKDSSASSALEDREPSTLQLQRLFVHAAIPMVAFGIVDQSVLIYMGDVIDNTVGVYFGLPTLAAAAMGQVFSDTSGVMFGGTIESIALKTGLPLPGLTEAQQRMTKTKMVSTAGGVIGVICGCFIGMLNLLVIDLAAAERAKRQKELETIMSTVIEDGRSVITCDRATMWIVDKEADELWTRTASGIDHEIRIPLDAGVAGWVAEQGQMVNIADTSKDQRFTLARKRSFAKKLATQTDDYVPKSMLCYPVKKGEEVVGVIQCLNKKDEATGEVTHFTGNDEKIVKMLATHVGIFIEQADL